MARRPPPARFGLVQRRASLLWHASTEKQLLELECVINKLADIYEPHDARLWLFARQRLLKDQVPAVLIQQAVLTKLWHRSTSCSTGCIW